MKTMIWSLTAVIWILRVVVVVGALINLLLPDFVRCSVNRTDPFAAYLFLANVPLPNDPNSWLSGNPSAKPCTIPRHIASHKLTSLYLERIHSIRCFLEHTNCSRQAFIQSFSNRHPRSRNNNNNAINAYSIKHQESTMMTMTTACLACSLCCSTKEPGWLPAWMNACHARFLQVCIVKFMTVWYVGYFCLHGRVG